MIVVNNISSESRDGYHLLTADVNNADEKFTWHYKIENKYLSMINTSAEPFLLPALLFAMSRNEDLKIDGMISPRLHWGVEQLLLPVWLAAGKRPPALTVKVQPSFLHGKIRGGVCTGFSGGIDSFYTILSNMPQPNKLGLSYLLQIVHENVSFSEETDDMRQYNEEVTSSLRLPLICISSNIVEHLPQAFEQIHTFINVSHALACSPAIGTYLYSSGFDMNNAAITFTDSAYYDMLTHAAIRTESFEFVSFTPLVNRTQKTIAISDNTLVQDYLHICFAHGLGHVNCALCEKCVRTLLTLDVIGKVMMFKKSFDLHSFYKYRNRFWGNAIYRALINRNPFYIEIIALAKSKKFKLPFCAYFYCIHYLTKKILKKNYAWINFSNSK